MMKLRLLLIMLSNLLTFHTWAQESAHQSVSRVSEVELLIEDRAKGYIEKYIASDLFEVKVKVDPLYRSYDGKSKGTSEILPYFQGEDESRIDEWYDPSTPFFGLLSRIRGVRVELQIDDSYRLEDPENFKQALLVAMGLLPGRDQVNLVFRSFHYFKKSLEIKDFARELFYGTLLFLLSLGVVAAIRSMIRKSNHSAGNQSTPISPSLSPTHSGPQSQKSEAQSFGERGNLHGNISFTDNLKLKEIIIQKVVKFKEQQIFPNLQQLIILEELLKRNGYAFRYLVSQFPPDQKEHLLSLGRGDEWLKGFVDVGIASDDLLLYLDRLVACEAISFNVEFEQCLIYFWRLSHRQEDFLRGIEKDKALTILYFQPKSESLPLARKLYPGAWAEVIADVRPTVTEIFQELTTIKKKLLDIFPLFDPKNMMSFRSKQDLMQYLRQCPPQEEREIYQTLGDGLALEQLRPPFYKFFELSIELRKVVFKQFSIKDWALSCFNIDRILRGKIDEVLDEKQKYLFISHLKEFDQGNLIIEQQSEVREQIGKAVFSIRDFSSKNKDMTMGSEREDVAA